MLLMEFLLSFVLIGIEVVAFYFLHAAFLPARNNRKLRWLILLVTAVLSTAITQSSLGDIEKLIVLVLDFAAYLYLFGGSVFWHILLKVLTVIMTGVIDTGILFGTSLILNIPLNLLVWRRLLYTIVIIAGKLLTLFLFWLILYFRKRHKYFPVRASWTIIILIFPIASIAMLYIVFLGYRDSNDLSLLAFIFSIVLAVANICILCLIQKMEQQIRREREIALLGQQMEIQSQSIIALEKSYSAQRQATHEFQHHLQTIENLLDAERDQAAQEYISALLNTQKQQMFCIQCGHPIVDALLNQKHQLARENNIDMQIQVNDLSGISVPNEMLVVLLSNLLDNAIEACEKLSGERTILCRFVLEDTLFLSVQNSSLPVVITDGRIQTTKEPKEEHGFGLVNAGKILDQLGAEYTFAYENNVFRFVAEIPQ